MSAKIARVTVNLSLDRMFDYRIPDSLEETIRPGMKVNVPFGRGAFRQAYVMQIAENSDFPLEKLKSIDSIVETFPGIPDPLLRLSEWMADYYCCPRELTLRALLPGAVRNGRVKPKVKTHYRIADHGKAAEYIARNENSRCRARVELLKTLMLERELVKDVLLVKAGAGKSALDALVRENLVIADDRQEDRDPFRNVQLLRTVPMTPTAEQAAALEQIRQVIDGKTSQHVLLLHGVTCSGKTEVYLQAIDYAIRQGGSAIVLVPEIALTPQTFERFRARFGDMVSVLHSGLSDGERYDEWMKVHTGRVRIAVGARSALFAPFTDLKLIIVDEEHDSSYKQSEAPRYHARDVAVMRGKMEHAAVILGSATPSLESRYNSRIRKYALAEMKHRTDPDIVLPDVKIVDMRLESDEEGHVPFLSKQLIEAVRTRISLGEQSILFLNRRGYAKSLRCNEKGCDFVAECPDCGVPYTFHKKMGILTCHLCGAMKKAPETCPKCGSKEIRLSGAGTERIENMSFAAFKEARIARMDSDTMTRPELYEQVLSSFRKGDIDVLVGTQMIAKGLDFPNVTFVGVVNADMGLFLNDFRVAERTFQLLTQVAGRAGRGESRGEVIFQTCAPFNPAIIAAADHDCESFYSEELPVREMLTLPPYSHVVLLRFAGEDSAKVMEYALALAERLKPYLDPATIVTDPAPCPIEKIKGKSRFMSMYRGGQLSALKQRLRYEAGIRKPGSGIEFHVDVDPVSLL